MNDEAIPLLITARSASTRLSRKLLKPFGPCSVLAHDIRRARHFGFEPIVVCPLGDRPIINIALVEDVKFFEGDEVPQIRWLQAMQTFGLKFCHAVDADDPFFDAGEITRSISHMIKNKLRHVYPTKRSDEFALGLMGHSLSLEKGWLSEQFLPEEYYSEMCRMTLDYEEDYWMLRILLRMFGPHVTRRQMDQKLEDSPIVEINWFRNDEWRAHRASNEGAA